MKKLLIILLALLPVATSGQVIKDIDEFTGEVTYRSESPRPITSDSRTVDQAYLMAFYRNPHYAIGIIAVSDEGDGFSYNTDTAYFLLDGDRMQLNVADTDMSYQDMQLRSTAMIAMTQEQFERMRRATEVRAKIDDKEFTIPLSARYDIADILDKIKADQ